MQSINNITAGRISKKRTSAECCQWKTLNTNRHSIELDIICKGNTWMKNTPCKLYKNTKDKKLKKKTNKKFNM